MAGFQNFKQADVLDLGRVRRLDTLLAALEAGMPADAIVYVEGVAFADDVRSALATLPAAPEAQRRGGGTCGARCGRRLRASTCP